MFKHPFSTVTLKSFLSKPGAANSISYSLPISLMFMAGFMLFPVQNPSLRRSESHDRSPKKSSRSKKFDLSRLPKGLFLNLTNDMAHYFRLYKIFYNLLELNYALATWDEMM